MKTFFVEIKIKNLIGEIEKLILEIQAKTKEDAISTAKLLYNPNLNINVDY